VRKLTRRVWVGNSALWRPCRERIGSWPADSRRFSHQKATSMPSVV
jgi:hypothetical protein